MFTREMERSLIAWKNQTDRLPLLLRGARQVGKSSLVEKFAKEHFTSHIIANLEFKPELKRIFSTSLDPNYIVQTLSIIFQQDIIPGETLLFVDEIQECPEALLALRYFKEQMPELHTVAAGSLLEFALNQEQFRFPVGRVQSLFMYPMSFVEFLLATKKQKFIEYIEKLDLNIPFSPLIHQELMGLAKQYFILGGMPAVLNRYVSTNNLNACQELQRTLLNGYEADFPKYGKKINLQLLQNIYGNLHSLVGLQCKYEKIIKDVRAREIKPILEQLVNARLFRLVKANSASEIPLVDHIHDKRFKLLALDVGLMVRRLGIAGEILLQNNLMTNTTGQLTEQFVGQELAVYHDPNEDFHLFYWEREKKGSQAEVDYVIQIDDKIIPIEIKSGTTGTLRSLLIFLEEKKCPLGIRISEKPLSLEKNILSVPFYMVSQIPRLVKKYWG